MINSLGSSHSAYSQLFQSTNSTSSRAGRGQGLPVAGLQGDVQSKSINSRLDLLAQPDAVHKVEGASSSGKPGSKGTSGAQTEQSPEEETKVRELKDREAEVRAHEAAHSAAGGAVTGGTSFEYTRGPDGKQYVISGEVQIDTSGGGSDPESIISQMDAVIRAATAPAEPSAQDRQVAAQAQQTRTEAIADARQQASEEESKDEDSQSTETGLHSLIAQTIEAYQTPLDQAGKTDFSV